MNTRNRKSSLAIAIAAVLALAVTTAVAQASTNKGAMKKGSSWIAKTTKRSIHREFPGYGFEADAISAINAARLSGSGQKTSADDPLVDDLKAHVGDYADSAGSWAKVALAAVASGANPQCFGDADAYAQLGGYYELPGHSKGQYGQTSFDQALALLALKAMHRKIPSAAIKFAKKQRGSNGWNFAMSTSKGDDVESTALMIEALRAAGVSKKDSGLKKAFKWLYNQRNQQAGFNPGDPGGATQANTTAFAIRAASALGKNLKKSKSALRALQKKQGWFRNDSATDYAPGQTHGAGIATSDAVIALSGRHYPVKVRSKAGASCG